MFIQPIKTWFHEHAHMPGQGHAALRISHVLHDSRFWVLLIAGVVIALFIILAIFAGGTGRGNDLPLPQNPMFPYIY